MKTEQYEDDEYSVERFIIFHMINDAESLKHRLGKSQSDDLKKTHIEIIKSSLEKILSM